jgi:glutamate--cysteine ligase/glutathione synthase
MHNTNYTISGYEDMELSTQLLIKEALKMDIRVEVLDRMENFIRLSRNGKVEYVKQATKTSLDTYMTFLIMENKIVTKYVLSKSGVRVPEGRSYNDIQTAIQDYPSFKEKKVAIKPVTTNFGIGISIKEPFADEQLYQHFLEIAFSHSPSVIMEEFIEGQEYRFLVMDFKTEAITNRVPANVIGDGVHTIQKLVEIKNEDPRRGKGHKTPLEKIELDETELTTLKVNYSMTPDSIPSKDTCIYLRKNSNVSTGGDSIDVTDDVHPDYKQIAEKAARSVSAKLCGVDLIAEDITMPPSETNYAILELNFNPVLYMHEFPYRGKPRAVAKRVLEILGY